MTEPMKLNITILIPEPMHRAWKAVCALKKIDMKDALVSALKEWIIANASELNPDALASALKGLTNEQAERGSEISSGNV